jgi:GNAT superfamily N-acetyltransferase
MNKFEEQLEIIGINDIELNVWSFNQNAVTFYEKKGYITFSQKMRKVLK